jgi:alkanesulfonate monooxygenase SsuD/methylene tetrahydromethanopterin reductase-like flavin-dependent oxidoreductase (luciferase family)
MSNYPIRFGFCLPIFAWPGAHMFRTPGFAALDTQRCMQLGALAEQLGYDSLWAADHLMLGHEDAILEGWTVLAALAGMTNKAQLGIIHYNNVFRHPAFTAKMVATLDQISNGRMIHFIDLGNNAREYLSYGMHEDDPRERRIAQMVEGLELTLRLWAANEPLTFSGVHYYTRDAVCNPKPVQQPCPKIWMGEVHPDIVAATVKYADAWNSVPVPMSELRKRIVQLDEACVEAERDPASLERTLEIQILIAPTLDALRDKLRRLQSLAPADEQTAPDLAAFLSGATDELPEELRESWWCGTPEMVRDRVADCIELGFTHFMGWFVDAPDDSGLRLFAEQVAPHFRS